MRSGRSQSRFYTGSTSKIALPTVPGSSRTAVKAAMQQLTCGHPADAVAKQVVLHVMHTGIMRHAARLGGEARSQGNLAEAALQFLYETLVVVCTLPPALLPLPTLDAHVSEVQLLGPSMRMLTQPGPRLSKNWYWSFSFLALVLTRSKSIVVARDASLCNVLLTAAEDASRAIQVTCATTDKEVSDIM